MNIEKLPDDKTNRLERNVAGKYANGPIIDDGGRLKPTDCGQYSGAGEPRLHYMNPSRSDGSVESYVEVVES
jgi:hypothetical protein